MKKTTMAFLAFTTLVCSQLALAGPFDPDCTVEKAAKSAAAKATVGVGGRCTPAEAAKDTAHDAVGDSDGDRNDRKHDEDDDDNGDNNGKHNRDHDDD